MWTDSPLPEKEQKTGFFCTKKCEYPGRFPVLRGCESRLPTWFPLNVSPPRAHNCLSRATEDLQAIGSAPVTVFHWFTVRIRGHLSTNRSQHSQVSFLGHILPLKANNCLSCALKLQVIFRALLQSLAAVKHAVLVLRSNPRLSSSQHFQVSFPRRTLSQNFQVCLPRNS